VSDESAHVELIRRAHESLARGDMEGYLAAFHSDVEYDMSYRPDGRVYRGHDGVREARRMWANTWDEHRGELEELIDLGAHMAAAREAAR
jgi:ketosteroid isomerase-like protein